MKKIAIVALTYWQARLFAENNNLRPASWIYVFSEEQCRGANYSLMVRLNGWRERAQYKKVLAAIHHLENRRATIILSMDDRDFLIEKLIDSYTAYRVYIADAMDSTP